MSEIPKTVDGLNLINIISLSSPRSHPDYNGYFLSYELGPIHVYGRKVELDDVLHSLPVGCDGDDKCCYLGGSVDDLATSGNLYDAIRVEFKISCVDKRQRTNGFESRLKEIEGEYASQNWAHIISRECGGGRFEYILRGVINQDVLWPETGPCGRGLLSDYLDMIVSEGMN